MLRRKCKSSWWRHQMETFSALLALCAGIPWSLGNSPHKGQWCRALILSLVCAWINGWVNNHEAGDLRRHHAHYDITVMVSFNFINKFPNPKQIYILCCKLIYNKVNIQIGPQATIQLTISLTEITQQFLSKAVGSLQQFHFVSLW